MPTSKFNFYSDDSHGWLEVNGTQLRLARCFWTDFSACSYVGRNDCFYLEEDGDATKFADRWGQAGNNEMRITYIVQAGRSPIRNMHRIGRTNGDGHT